MRNEEGKAGGKKQLRPNVIYENSHFLVIDKPSGWVVNESVTVRGNPTIQNWLKINFNYPLSDDDKLRNGIVHRLDKETSGVLIVAKTRKVFDYLQGLFKERKVKKVYIALVHGKIEVNEGVIEAEVGRLSWNRKRFGVIPGGRYSKTGYEVQKIYKLGSDFYTLVKFFPETGRTHQIRIHAKHFGHPIVSDEFYAGRKTSRADRKWCPRLFLHAESISFNFSDGNYYKFDSKLPKELSSVINLENITSSN